MIKDGINLNTGENYEQFVEKFKPKKTTDDCITPPYIYKVVADWVANTYKLNKADFVRPFWPGADYTTYNYRPNNIVVDNPPFSIISQITKYYIERNIKFFLFAPSLVLFAISSGKLQYLLSHSHIEYKNGAKVSTSFVTNLESDDIVVRTVPDLHNLLDEVQKQHKQENQKKLPKYKWPDNVTHSARLNKIAGYPEAFVLHKDECFFIRNLESSKKSKKQLYGNGFLISDRKAAELKAAELKAAEKAIEWELSDEEKEIIKKLK